MESLLHASFLFLSGALQRCTFTFLNLQMKVKFKQAKSFAQDHKASSGESHRPIIR